MRLSEAQRTEAVQRYVEYGQSQQQVADHFDVTKSAIYALLRRREITARRCGAPALPARHDAFEALTPDAAYWVGLMFADGSVAVRPGRTPIVVVALSDPDRPHLVKLRTFLGSGHAITAVPGHAFKANGTTYKCRPGHKLSLSSAQLGGRLLSLGRYDGPIDAGLTESPDFWRGVVDGDGTLGVYRDKPHRRQHARFGLCGEPRLLEAFNDFLSLNGLARRSLYPGKGIHNVAAKWRPAAQIVTLLYRDAATALDRKLAKAREIMQLSAA